MECAYCGRQKKLFETFTSSGLCPDCNKRLRRYIKSAMQKLHDEVPLCAPGCHEAPAPLEQLTHIETLLALIDELEDLRPRVPSFKTSTKAYHDALLAYRRSVREAAGLSAEAYPHLDPTEDPAWAQDPLLALSLPPVPKPEAEEHAEEPLPDLPLAPMELELGAEPPAKKRNPADIAGLVYSRITKGVIERLRDFVVLTLQVTGPNPKRHEIIDISAIRFTDRKPAELFTTLLVPRRSIPLSTSLLSGVSNEMVRGAPILAEVLPALKRFLGDLPLVGHNLAADLAFLYANGLDLAENQRLFDLLPIVQNRLVRHKARRKKPLPEERVEGMVEDYTLPTLCAYYDIPFSEERWGGRECLSAGLLFCRLLEGTDAALPAES